MNKTEILKIIGIESTYVENRNGSALCITINSDDIDVVITVPYGVHEMYFEAKDINGMVLVKDWFDFYGDMEVEDFKECLLDILDVIQNPVLRVTNNGKTIEAKSYKWYYFFGKFISE